MVTCTAMAVMPTIAATLTMCSKTPDCPPECSTASTTPTGTAVWPDVSVSALRGQFALDCSAFSPKAKENVTVMAYALTHQETGVVMQSEKRSEAIKMKPFNKGMEVFFIGMQMLIQVASVALHRPGHAHSSSCGGPCSGGGHHTGPH